MCTLWGVHVGTISVWSLVIALRMLLVTCTFTTLTSSAFLFIELCASPTDGESVLHQHYDIFILCKPISDAKDTGGIDIPSHQWLTAQFKEFATTNGHKYETGSVMGEKKKDLWIGWTTTTKYTPIIWYCWILYSFPCHVGGQQQLYCAPKSKRLHPLPDLAGTFVMGPDKGGL